jgi:hypothetical protein
MLVVSGSVTLHGEKDVREVRLLPILARRVEVWRCSASVSRHGGKNR